MILSLLRMSGSPRAPSLAYPCSRLPSSWDHHPSHTVKLTAAAVSAKDGPEHGGGASPQVGVVCGRGTSPERLCNRSGAAQRLSPYSRLFLFSSLPWCSPVRSSVVAQSHSRVRICNIMNCSTPGLPVYHQLPEFTQTHVH